MIKENFIVDFIVFIFNVVFLKYMGLLERFFFLKLLSDWILLNVLGSCEGEC